MPKTYLVVKSITQAMRGQEALSREMVTSYIERNKGKLKNYGCGYSLKINAADLNRAVEILNRRGVKVADIVEEGDL